MSPLHCPTALLSSAPLSEDLCPTSLWYPRERTCPRRQGGLFEAGHLEHLKQPLCALEADASVKGNGCALVPTSPGFERMKGDHRCDSPLKIKLPEEGRPSSKLTMALFKVASQEVGE